jgi:predicted nucleic acid-binding protein
MNLMNRFLTNGLAKFRNVDCAIAGRADYIVTIDKHFNTLKQIDFPKVNVISIDEFIKILKN